MGFSSQNYRMKYMQGFLLVSFSLPLIVLELFIKKNGYKSYLKHSG